MLNYCSDPEQDSSHITTPNLCHLVKSTTLVSSVVKRDFNYILSRYKFWQDTKDTILPFLQKRLNEMNLYSCDKSWEAQAHSECEKITLEMAVSSG